MITRAQLLQRREHEKQRCFVSPSGLIDERCASCRQIDDELARETTKGWTPTVFDRRFLKSLRIEVS
jgi:hypothetical protein